MDRQALATGLFGVAIGAVGCYFLMRRYWWRATGWLALGAALLLNLITEGPHSPGEDLVKAAVAAGLMLIFVVAGVVQLRNARAMRDRTAARHH